MVFKRLEMHIREIKKIIHCSSVDPMFTVFTDRQKWKPYISQSSSLGGEQTGQDKNKE